MMRTLRMPPRWSIVGLLLLGTSAARAVDWEAQAKLDAAEDRTTVIYDGITPNKMVCDTTLEVMPDGTWVLFFLAGGDTEPSPKNYTAVSRSTDEGKTW